jgi:ABC-type uncharacterized transport system involved in gliding motility auxiliary subunit
VTYALPHFRPTYGAIPTEAIVQLVDIGVQAGTSIASTAIASKSQQKLAASQKSHARKMAALQQKKLALEAKLAEVQERSAKVSTRPASTAPAVASEIPGWAIGLGAAVLLGIGGVFIYTSRKKPAPPPEQVD